jgi:hypothetical protein
VTPSQSTLRAATFSCDIAYSRSPAASRFAICLRAFLDPDPGVYWYHPTASGRGKESKAPWELPMWFVATFRDGLCLRIEFYLDLEQALEAAGLSE